MNIKFSVIIPVYNSGKPLKKCVDSIAYQPFTDYEVILIDDGSDDVDTIEILRFYEDRSDRVKIFHKPNGGCVDARRYGVQKAKGEYIVFGDGDDYFDEGYILTLHEVTEKLADYYVFNNYLVDAETKNIYVEKDFLITGYASLDWTLEHILHARMNAVWDKMFRRDLFGINADIIPQNIIFGEDIYINNRYLPHARSVYVMDKAIYYHCLDTKTSVCARKATLRNLSDAEVVFNSLGSYKEIPEATKKRLEAYRDYQYGYFVRAIASLYRNACSKSEIDTNIADYNIIKNIRVHRACSIKGAIYRVILKYQWYGLAAKLWMRI